MSRLTAIGFRCRLAFAVSAALPRVMSVLTNFVRAKRPAGTWSVWLAVALACSAAPVHAQETLLRLLAAESQVYRMPAGQRQGEMRFGVDLGTQRLNIEILSPLASLVQSVRTPSGAVLTPENAQAMGGAFARVPQGAGGSAGFPFGSPTATVYRWTVPISQPGHVVLSFANSTAVLEDVPVIAQALSDSPTRVALIPLPSTVAAATPVALAVAVVSGAQPLAGAAVEAVVMAGNRVESAVTLLDDGGEADATAGDGIYSALYVPSSDGVRTVAITTRAQVAGVLTTRQTSASLEVRKPSANFYELHAAQPWQIEDTNGDGRKDRLSWGIHVSVSKPGPFRLLVGLRAGDRRLTTSSERVLPAGVSRMSVDFTAQRLESEGVGAGRYDLEQVELQDLSDSNVRTVDRFDPQRIGPQRSIDLTGIVFDRAPLLLRGTPRFFGSDPNSGGLWRKLVVEVEVDSTVADFIKASTSLYSGTRMIATCSGTGYALIGVSKIGINCIGRDIGSLGIDGPFDARELWAYRVNSGPPATLRIDGTFARSGAIRAAEFEGADRRPEDVNADGSVTCFDLSLVRNNVGLNSLDFAFDPRLDVDRNGVISEGDAERVRGALPAGVACPAR